MAFAAGCLANPQRMQSIELLDQLAHARGMLTEQPSRADDACNTVGDVQTRLYGEPGLHDVRPAWTALRDTATALHAVCGQTALLSQQSNGSSVLVDARARWQQGIQRELSLACDHLREAAAALDRAAPC